MTTNPRGLPLDGDNAHRLPLEGVRVAAVTVVWAGPHVTQLLAEWGAEVIRVEPMNRVQPYSRLSLQRQSPEVQLLSAKAGVTFSLTPDLDPGLDPWNRGSAFNAHARNKRSMTCDITSPEGHEAFLRLIAECDVLVENNVPETIERAHITYEELRAVNPNLIMLRMPAFGLDGPYKNFRGFGTHVEGMIGHHHLRSYEDLGPEYTGDAFTADAIAGILGAFAVTAALRHRDRTGQGQQIEMPLAEAFLPVLGEWILDYTYNGRVAPAQGNRHATHAPHGIYPSSGDDQWIAIDVFNDEEFTALNAVLKTTLHEDERFATNAARLEHRRALDVAIAEHTAPWDKFELFHALQAQGVIAGPVMDELDALASAQLEARGWFEEVTQPGVGTHRHPGILFRMAGTPNYIRRPPPNLGQDNEDIYLNLLGYTREEYEALIAKGLVGTTYSDELLRTAP
ncbi:MAG: CoA transferase [Chloroflexi bacterium]|nr:CoA transferase [Chloroflexota bacterium]MDA1146052.1 CoA transferase [Chloroflexota bacterium]